MKSLGLLARLSMAWVATALPLLAQDEDVQALKQEMETMKQDYEERIGALELAQELMEYGNEWERIDPQGNQTGMGDTSSRIGQLGQTDRFSKAFNPAFGMVLDLLAVGTTNDVSLPGQDEIWLRAAELNVNAQIDPFGYAYATIEGTSQESGIFLLEAAGVLNRLPANFTLRGGLMLADMTRYGPHHVHELPFVEKPRVLIDYIGGSLRGPGAELHQWFGLTDEIPVRWSMGMYSELEGHNHAIGLAHHHDHGSEDPEYKRKFSNFSYTGRIASFTELTEASSMQLGTSAWWAPEIVVGDEDERHDLYRAVGSFDAMYLYQDPATRQTFMVGAEALLSNGRYFHEEAGVYETFTDSGWGGYLWSEYAWNPNWAVGLMADGYAIKDDSKSLRQDYSGWLTWKVSHFNWLRFTYRYNDFDATEHLQANDYHEFILQWVIVVGSHYHGLDERW